MKNIYDIKNELTEIIINSKKNGVIKVKIDTEDIDKCSKIKWYYAKNKDSEYIEGTYKGKKIKLHRFILNATNNKILVDHINRNTLDNRKLNLRFATNQENSFNKSVRSDNKSGYPGVDFRNNKWRAKIKYDGQTIHLGYFIDKDEAILNRQLAEKYLFKEFSPTINLITDDEDIICRAKKNIIQSIEKKIA